MKTVTEFPGVVIRQVLKTKKELMASGSTEEQMPEALGQAYKIEGDRLNHLLKSLTLVGENVERLSRVRVFAGEEGVQAPQGAVKEGEHFYCLELVSLPSKPGKHGSDERDSDRGGKGGRGDKKRGGGKGRGGKGGGRDGDRPREGGGGGRFAGNKRDDRAGAPAGAPGSSGSASATPRVPGQLPKPRVLPLVVAKPQSAAPTPAAPSVDVPAKEPSEA